MSRKHGNVVWKDVDLTCSLLRLIIPESSMSCSVEMLLLLLWGSEEPQSTRIHREYVIRTPRASCSSLSSSYRASERLDEVSQQSHPAEAWKLDARPHAHDVIKERARDQQEWFAVSASAPFSINISLLSLSVLFIHVILSVSGMFNCLLLSLLLHTPAASLNLVSCV